MIYFYKLSIIFPLLAILLSFLVFSRNPRKPTHATFFLMGISAALFTFFIFISYLFENRSPLTTVFNRFSVAFTVIQVGLNLYFSMIFPTLRIRHPLKVFALVCLPVLLVAGCALATNLFVVSMEIQTVNGALTMVRETGILYRYLYAPMVAGYILAACCLFYKQYRAGTTSIEKKHVLYTAIAICTGGITSTITCIVLPLSGVTEFYAFGPVLVAPLYVCLMSYNILSLKAMDVDQFIARVLMFSFSILLVISLIGYTTYTILETPEKYTAATATLLMLGSFLVVLFYMVTIQPEIDRRIRRHTYKLRDEIERFNHQSTKLKSLDDLVKSIFNLIEKQLRPANISFFIRRKNTGEFFLHNSRNYSGGETIILTQQQLITVPILFDEVIEKEQVEQNPAYQRYQDVGTKYFKAFDCVLAVPITFEDEMIGVLNVGARPDSYYKRIEIEFLEKLKTGINIALHNSMHLKQIQEINDANARFVPAQFLSFLGKQDLIAVELGDHVQKEMTIVFSDIKEFTTLSEAMSPGENFAFINAYLERVSPVIRRKNGFVDKYVGDAIMALFPDCVDDALEASLLMLREIKAFNASLRHFSLTRPVEAGIGLHTGILMLGTIGEKKRMEGTVISDAVNLTNRIERMTRVFGSTLIISEQAFSLLTSPENHQYRHLGNVAVKGKKTPVGMIDLFDEDPEEIKRKKIRTKTDFENGIHFFLENSFQQAIHCLTRVIDADFNDPASLFYLARAKLSLQQLQEP